MQVNGDDGSGDIFGVVDDFVDSGHSLSDVHAGDACKVERLESHLSGWFSDALSSQCSNGFSGLDDASVNFFAVDVEEESELQICDSVECVS